MQETQDNTIQLYPYLARDAQGRFLRTISNFSWILSTDPYFGMLRFDELADAPVLAETVLGKPTHVRRWTDADDAAAMEYIEETYRLYDRRKYHDAFLQRMREVSYNPVREAVEREKWDGEKRCEHFLSKWAKCDDTPYTREVSRLIFAGGIWRLYRPGCKFDYLPVLIGTRQGEGKSTLVRWLALDDRWYGELTVFEGKEAVEQLTGTWICEVTEMLAFGRSRDQETIKSFITRQNDRYRPPYAERVEERPRRAILVGTTNNRNFLRDKTGNRRFLPVEVRSEGSALYAQEAACRAYIRQCWAEALVRFRSGVLYPVASPELRDTLRAVQDEAMEDDWRVGAIGRYLEDKPAGSYVCVRELKREALYKDAEAAFEPGRSESREIGQIMDRMPGWERAGTISFMQYGKQRSWKKLGNKEQQSGT